MPSVSEVIDQLAPQYGLDPTAVKVVALGEGGLTWDAGRGDNGTSFGPFQLHVGGRLPRQYWGDPEAAHRFANSYAGINYALRKMAEVGAAGKTGLDAIYTIIYEFEEPADEAGSFARARARYLAWTKDGPPPTNNGSQPTATGMPFPVAGPNNYSNDWGNPRSGGRTHMGTDIFAKSGVPVVAVEDGTIATRSGGLGGNALWVGGKWYYAHLSAFAPGIRNGTQVKVGQVIGYVGDTGNAKGGAPHLHFGYDPNGTYGASWENPFPILQGQTAPPGAPVDDGMNPSLYGGPSAVPDEMEGDFTPDFLFGDRAHPPVVVPTPNVPEPPVAGADPFHDYGRGRRDYAPMWQQIGNDEWASDEAKRFAGV